MNPHYLRYRHGRSGRGAPVLLGLGGLTLAAVLAFGGIVWFRQSAERAEAVGAIQELPSPTEEDSQAPSRRNREEILMTDGVGGQQTVASREVEDRVFRHTIVAHLNDPPEGQFYEGWLLRQEPFDFFSTGRLDKNADGTYALIWEGTRGVDYQDYNRVIITLEADDGDDGPSAIHLLEGTF